MTDSPLLAIRRLGQSIWLDDIHRGMLKDGSFRRLVEEEGVAGVTSNPAILEKAITEHDDYDQELRNLAALGHSPVELYEQVSLEDLRQAADILRPIYESSGHRDGMVSMEVSPRIAYDTETTVRESRRLWQAFDRPNAMIKVPATQEGLPAIQTLTSEGINVNATLLFSRDRYRDVWEQFLSGLEIRQGNRLPVNGITSVASFFISRIDTKVDALLAERPELASLQGKAAVSVARLCYQDHLALRRDDRWRRMEEVGAQPQRLLWASMSTKNPAYSDIKYVEALIAPETVSTLPLQTLEAYRDHGRPEIRIDHDLEDAQQTVDRLESAGLHLEEIASELEREGVQKFIDAYDRLLDAIGGNTGNPSGGR